MTPAEWWAEFDSKSAAQKRMTKPAGKIPDADWEAARRKFRERKLDRTVGPSRKDHGGLERA